MRVKLLFSLLCLYFPFALAGEGTITAEKAKYLPSEEQIIGEKVVIKYEDYEVRGDKVILNLKDNTGTVEGNALLIKGGEVLRGEKLFFDWDKETWKMMVGKVEIEKERLQGAEGPLFLYAEEAGGGEKELSGRRVSLTTCSLPHPHYSVTAKELFVLFGDKLVAKDVSFVVLDKPLFHLPYIVIPLKTVARQSIIPQFGSDPYQGFFIKSSYPYISTAVASGILKLDYIQKRGTGQGIEHTFKYPNLSASFSLYHLSPAGGEGESLTTGGKLNWDKAGWRFSLLSDFQKNSLWYGGSSQTSSYEASLGQNTPRGSLDINYRLQNMRGGYYSSDSSFYSLLYNLRPDSKSNLRLNLEGSDLAYGGSSEDKELRSSFTFTQQGKIGWELITTRRYDLDKDSYPYDTNYFFLEKMPEITLKPSQLFPSQLFDAEIKLGRYRQLITKPFLSRYTLSLSSSLRFPKSPGMEKKPFLNVRGEFFQGVYGDGTALYSYSLAPSLQLPIGPSSLSLSFKHTASRGYSPFYADQVYPYSTLNIGWVLSQRKERYSLQGGYDFRNGYPYSITGNIELSPKWGNLTMYMGYEPRTKVWRDIIANLRIGKKEEPLWNINIRYATEEGRLGFCRGMGKLQFGKFWSLEGYFGYNGYTDKFDELDLSLTRDLHCWVASLLYNKRRKEFSFNIYLKAFPIQMRTLGIGGQGQYYGTSVGTYY